MLVILIPLTILSIFICLRLNEPLQQNAHELREPFLKSLLIFGLLNVLATESLSIFHAIDQPWLAIFWTLATIIPILICRKKIMLGRPNARNSERLDNASTKSLLTALSLIFVTVGITALVTPPNTWDSLTTHLARASHWAANHSVTNYPTSMLKQLNYPPGSSYILLHLNILANSDILANLPQWFAMVAGTIGLSLIAYLLGANTQEQIMTAILAATLPMAIMQGSSTQNEQINSLWIISFVYFILKYRRNGRASDLLASAIGLALAASVKGTGPIFALPFLAWVTWERWSAEKYKAFRIPVAAILAILIVNGPFYARCISLTGSVIPANEHVNMINTRLNPASTATNVIRNIAVHLMAPNDQWNKTIKGLVGKLDRWDEKKASFTSPTASDMFREDVAGNGLHLILILLSGALACIPLRHRPESILSARYAFAVAASFLLFSIFVHWTPFNSRYHLAVFLLFMPWVALTLSRTSQKLALTIVIIVTITAAPWLFFNQSRPWSGSSNIFTTSREKKYFANNPGFIYSYEKTLETIKRSGCNQIGLDLSEDSWEYPLWVIANQKRISPRFEHVLVNNESAKLSYPAGPFKACAIISEGQDPRDEIPLNDELFRKTRAFPFLTLYQPANGVLTDREELAAAFSAAIEPIHITSVSTPEEQSAFINTVSARLRATKRVDLAILSKVDLGVAEAFSKFYRLGLMSMEQGFRKGDTALVRSGVNLMQTWNLWIADHIRSVEKVFSP